MNFDSITEYLILGASLVIMVKYFFQRAATSDSQIKLQKKEKNMKDFEFENLVRDKEREILLRMGEMPRQREGDRVVETRQSLSRDVKNRTFRGVLQTLQRAALWDENAFDELWSIHSKKFLPMEVKMVKAAAYFKALPNHGSEQLWKRIVAQDKSGLEWVVQSLFIKHLFDCLKQGTFLHDFQGRKVEFPYDGLRLWTLIHVKSFSKMKQASEFNAKFLFEMFESISENGFSDLCQKVLGNDHHPWIGWDQWLEDANFIQLWVPLTEEEVESFLTPVNDDDSLKQNYHRLLKLYHPDKANFSCLKELEDRELMENFFREQLNINMQLINRLYELKDS